MEFDFSHKDRIQIRKWDIIAPKLARIQEDNNT